MSLSTLAIVLGLAVAVFNAFGVLKPAAFGAALRKFPRSLPWGYTLMLLATGWFIWNVRCESISDFEALKPFLYALFAFVGVGACIYVKDFLAVRGVAVVILLLSKVMLDAARWTDSDWRLVVVVWAYMMIFTGMWLTISPWRLRNLIEWQTANEGRLRLLNGVRAAFGLFVAVLGATVF